MSAILKTNQMDYALLPFHLKELVVCSKAPDDIYCQKEGIFQKILRKNTEIKRKDLLKFIEMGLLTLYTSEAGKSFIDQKVRSQTLIKSRSLFRQDPEVAGPQHMNFLSMNLEKLYKDPFEEALLKFQHQNTKVFAQFLIHNRDHARPLYDHYSDQQHFYTISQPLLSSLLLMNFLQTIDAFSEGDLQRLFIISYFKDIGMSFISKDRLSKEKLSERDRSVLTDHPETSVDLLRDRIQLDESELKIIKHHHWLGEKFRLSQTEGRPPENIMGFETVMVGMFDIIAAMVTSRPYRNRFSLFETLEYVRTLVGTQYRAEFKALVLYLHRFYSE